MIRMKQYFSSQACNKRYRRIMDWILLVVSSLHLYLCPYTKVEESFNLQAIHDILYYRGNFSQYDHLEFPGVVPRTFIGPLIISAIAAPFVTLAHALGYSKFISLYIVRSVLGFLVLWPLLRLTATLRRTLGKEVAHWFVLIAVSQFHFIYYLSRPLPNTMALVLVLFAYDFWLKQDHIKFIVYSAASIIIFRGELAVLLGFILFGEILKKRVAVSRVMMTSILSGLACLTVTIIVDSLFWQRWLWPEGEVLWFNIYLNRSGEWGISPFFWYFYSAIPRAMGSSLLLVPIGVSMEGRIRSLLWPPLLFVLAYSVLPHKELRFIIYVIPLLNVAAAAACARMWKNRLKGRWRGIAAFITVVHLITNVTLTGFLIAVSQTNYPGGVAFSNLHELEPSTANISVHIDVFAAQTGISRFGELNSNWRYDKTENLKAGSSELRMFTHLILEARNKHSYNLRPYGKTHEIVAVIEGFSHIRSSYTSFPPIRIRTKPCLFILKNKNPPGEFKFSLAHRLPVEKLSNDVNMHVSQEFSNGEKETSDLDYDFEFSNHFDGDGLFLENVTEEADY